MGGVAQLAKAAGHRVTGCDAHVYPPMSDQLRAAGIELIEGYGADQLALKPDLAVYFDIDPKVSMERICFNRTPKFYEAGMDLKLSNDPYESYMIFQGRVIKEYQKMVDEFGLVQLDATDSIHSKQVKIREMLCDILRAKGIEI